MNDKLNAIFKHVYPEDLEAARNALRNRDPNDPGYKDLVTYFAERHARVGPRLFAVAIGNESARHPWEKTEAEMWSNVISTEESRKRYEQILREPLSEQLLEALYEDLEDSIMHYDRLLVLSRAAYDAYCQSGHFRSETDHASYHARETIRTTSLLKEQVIAAGRFAADCRARKGLSAVTLGVFSEFTALDLALTITDRAAELWHECLEKEGKAGVTRRQEDVAAWNFVKRYVPRLPSPQELRALVMEEFSLMRVTLQDCGPPKLPADLELSDESLTAPSNSVDPQPPLSGGKVPVLRNWAFGYEATAETWWLFHRKGRHWRQRQKVQIAGGLQTRIMLELANNNGRIDRSEFLALRKIPYSDRSHSALGKSVDQAVARLRGDLKAAIAAAARCAVSEIDNPIPLMNKRYVAEVEIGWSEPDENDPHRLQFQLQKDR